MRPSIHPSIRYAKRNVTTTMLTSILVSNMVKNQNIWHGFVLATLAYWQKHPTLFGTLKKTDWCCWTKHDCDYANSQPSYIDNL